jgi:subtilisin-like proprotein convertase family protein/spore coat protein CotH
LLSKAQVFSGSGGTIQDNGQDTYFTQNISGLNPPQIDSVFGLEQVCINITHPNVKELYISLRSPNGIIVELSVGSSISGPDYLNTCFDQQAGSSITLGTAPFTGTYRPVGQLGRFNTGQAGNGNWDLIVHDGFPFSNAGMVLSWDLKFGALPAHPVVFNSSNLPIVFINTTQPVTEFTTSITMGIIDNGTNRNYLGDPWNGYNGKAEINVRGNTTKNYPKKSFHIETDDSFGNEMSVPLLGMPSESDWVLCASYVDKTLLRIPLAYDLFRQMGHYSPRFRNVELVVNSEYRGMYSFIEKPKRNANRVNIEKLDPTENSVPYVTGGYIIKIDRSDEPGWFSFLPGNSVVNSKFYYQYDYPKPLEITTSQQSYIQTYMNDFETMMNSASYASITNGYPAYINVNSFIDFFIINELSKNVDAYRLSTFLVKESAIKGGKLSIGPVWDFDIAWHNCNYSPMVDGWAYQSQVDDYPCPTWWIRFMQDPNFMNQLRCRWNELRQNILSNNYLNGYIDANANAINEAQERNFRQWPILGAYIYPNPQNQSGASYASEIIDLKNWLTNRLAWLDANIPGDCAVGIQENVLVNNLNVYPNPMGTSTTFSMKLAMNADVSLCITDVAGKEVARYLNANVPAGDAKIVMERNQINSGIYLYQLQVNDAVRSGKLIIQ